MNVKFHSRIAERFTLLNHLSSSSLNHRGGEALGFVRLVRRRRWRPVRCCAVKDTCHSRDDVDTEIVVNKGFLGLVRPAIISQAEEAIHALKSGKVIAVPTDTLYGFACDACSKEAVSKIYEIKGREHTKPLAICVGDTTDIKRFAVTEHLPLGLLDSLLPGPVTVVLKRGESSILDKSLNPEAVNIGVRVPDCDFIRIIASGSRSALALTSANLSGKPSSVCIKDFESLWEHCAYVYDNGELPSGRAGSTVVRLTMPGKYKILRAGSAKKETVAILESYYLIDDGGAE